MIGGKFLNSSRSVVSMNDTGYFDPGVMTPRVCCATALKRKKRRKKKHLSGKRLTLVVGRRYSTLNWKN